MRGWIMLHESEREIGPEARIYLVQISQISRFGNYSSDSPGTIVYFVGDGDDWIMVTETPYEIVDKIRDNE
jgi:hypothetical protein